MTPYYSDDAVTIYHGDSLEVLPTLSGVDAYVTDPPYKLSQEYSASTDADNLLAVSSVWPVAPMMLAAAKDGALAAIYYDTRILPLALAAFQHAGWKYLRALTFYRRWGQASLVHGWMSSSDFILIYGKPGAKFRYHGSPRHDVYTRSSPDPTHFGHPAQKPLDATTHLVENVTPPGGLVVDPYMGSGTTLAVAKATGRRAIGIEIEERYCEEAAVRCSQEVLRLDAA